MTCLFFSESLKFVPTDLRRKRHRIPQIVNKAEIIFIAVGECL